MISIGCDDYDCGQAVLITFANNFVYSKRASLNFNEIKTRRMFGDAGGFGFRNYWAASIYNSMKIWY